MRAKFYILLIIGSVQLIASCSNKQYVSLFEKKAALSDTAGRQEAITLDRYHIQPQDVLQIRNLQNLSYIVDQPTSSGSTAGAGIGQSYQVEEDGTVGLPVIGRVKVIGLTRSEAQMKVEKLYKDSLLLNPIIELKITNLKVTILGEVRQPGNFPLIKDKTSLIEMIGQAGGLSDRANPQNIKIIRGGDKNPRVIIADLDNITSINDPNNVLQSGDIVYVSENKRTARTENLQNFQTLFSPILILFNTALIILTLARR